MTIIKFEADDREHKLIIHFTVKMLEEGFFLPYSYIKLLVLLHDMQDFADMDKIKTEAVSKGIVFSEQVVMNYFSTLKNFGVIYKPKQKSRKIKKKYMPDKNLLQ